MFIAFFIVDIRIIINRPPLPSIYTLSLEELGLLGYFVQGGVIRLDHGRYWTFVTTNHGLKFLVGDVHFNTAIWQMNYLTLILSPKFFQIFSWPLIKITCWIQPFGFHSCILVSKIFVNILSWAGIGAVGVSFFLDYGYSFPRPFSRRRISSLYINIMTIWPFLYGLHRCKILRIYNIAQKSGSWGFW